MSNLILKLKSHHREIPSFIARLSYLKIVVPVLKEPSEARVINSNNLVIDTVEINKKEVTAVNIEELTEVIEYLNHYLQNMEQKTIDLLQKYMNESFQTEEGRKEIKEMLIKAANSNKYKLKGQVKHEFFEVLETFVGDLK